MATKQLVAIREETERQALDDIRQRHVYAARHAAIKPGSVRKVRGQNSYTVQVQDKTLAARQWDSTVDFYEDGAVRASHSETYPYQDCMCGASLRNLVAEFSIRLSDLELHVQDCPKCGEHTLHVLGVSAHCLACDARLDRPSEAARLGTSDASWWLLMEAWRVDEIRAEIASSSQDGTKTEDYRAAYAARLQLAIQGEPETELQCFRKHEGSCSGQVGWHTYDAGRSYKNVCACSLHFERLLDAVERSRELQSDTPPEWFSEDYAGERWDEDY